MHNAGEHAAAGKEHLAHRQLDRKRLAILADSLDLPADADDLGLAGLEIGLDVGIVPVAVWRRHQNAQVLADRLFGGIAEHAFGGGVERVDDAALVRRDDGVHGGVDHAACKRLARPQRLLRATARGNVAPDGDQPAVAQRTHTDFGGDRLAVLALKTALVEGRFPLLDHPARVFHHQKILETHSQQFLPRAAEHLGGPRIDIEDLQGRTRDRDGVGSVFEDQPVGLFGPSPERNRLQQAVDDGEQQEGSDGIQRKQDREGQALKQGVGGDRNRHRQHHNEERSAG